MPPPDPRLAAEILAQFTDSASSRFDASLARMPLDEAQQRELRYWQRQSLVALRQYAAVAVPAVLAAVAAAQQDAGDAFESAARAWDEPQRPDVGSPPLEEAKPSPDHPDTLELRRRSVAARLASGA